MSKVNKLQGVITPEGQVSGILRNNEPLIQVSITESGATGAAGERGKVGKSAYEHWIDEGNEGSVQDFLFSLQLKESKTYIYSTLESSKVWEIQHPLNKYPSVTIVDSAGSVVYGNVEYLSESLVKITFTGAFNGKAYLN